MSARADALAARLALLRAALEVDPWMSSRELATLVEQRTGVCLSSNSVRAFLKRNGLAELKKRERGNPMKPVCEVCRRVMLGDAAASATSEAGRGSPRVASVFDLALGGADHAR